MYKTDKMSSENFRVAVKTIESSRIASVERMIRETASELKSVSLENHEIAVVDREFSRIQKKSNFPTTFALRDFVDAMVLLYICRRSYICNVNELSSACD
jgi:hypothetical protein